ncbi:MAG: succinylglutamate-semialdehyde dehydrogenase [Alphaproteobacteria bacterium]|nr:MAG: succinylglutamate-semialdehyde dehydrogenase [Alphaproteobacteria bacterium]
MIEGKNYIGGKWVQGLGDEFTSENPATGKVIWRGNEATAKEVNGAFDTAHEAYLGWRKMPLEGRIKRLRAYTKVIEDNRDKLARVISNETGKVLWDAISEVAAVIGKVENSIRAYGERTPTREGTLGALRTRLTHKPHGVMGVIGPYNFPCHLANGHIVPALLAGNTVVFKPSSWTPWSAEMMIGLMHQAGIPEGVVNLVQGGRDVGQAILGHPNLKGLLFTGGVPTGKLFAKALAERLEVIVALELGGNNPLIVWDAEDLDAAAIITIQSAYISAGQRCTCARRLIVPDNEYGKKVIAAVQKAIKGVEVGLPDADPQPFMGSLISEGAASAALDRQAELEGQGGVVLARAERLTIGPAFILPSLIDVTDITDRSDEECFGPLLQVIRVKDFDAALSEANDTNFGLAAGILTDNKALYETFYAEIEAGVVNWNQPLPGASSAAPFGGLKDSGNHRPAAYYAADYAAWPMASLENPENKLTRPALPIGLKI